MIYEGDYRLCLVNSKSKKFKQRYIVQCKYKNEWRTCEFTYGGAKFYSSFTIDGIFTTLLSYSYQLKSEPFSGFNIIEHKNPTDFIIAIEQFQEDYPELFI